MKTKIVKDALMECARSGKLITYKALISKANMTGHPLSMQGLFAVLTKIGNEEFSSGRPLINCLVINPKVDNLPGHGFYTWYMGVFRVKLNTNSCDARAAVFQELKEECFSYWKKAVEAI